MEEGPFSIFSRLCPQEVVAAVGRGRVELALTAAASVQAHECGAEKPGFGGNE